MNSSVLQMKMNTGDDIVADIVSWVEEEDDTAVMVRAAYCIRMMSSMNGERYFTLRPWMTFMEDNSKVLAINPDSIVSYCEPSPELLSQYHKVKEIYDKALEEQPELENQIYTGDEAEKKLREIFSSAFDSASDSDTLNVIQFPGKGRPN